MLALLLSLAAPQSIEVDRAAEMCGPKLAASAGGALSGIEVKGSTTTNGWTVIRGNLIVLSAMGPAGARVARTHHVIRTLHSYVCWIRNRRVIKLQLGAYPNIR